MTHSAKVAVVQQLGNFKSKLVAVVPIAKGELIAVLQGQQVSEKSWSTLQVPLS
jgi:hypothetical protein